MDGKNVLGLPIEYQEMPEYFDAHNINAETETKNALIEKLLKGHAVKSVLDMTCGTGSQVFYLAERGYEVVGSDFSPSLLNIARSKAEKARLKLTFIDGDMRTLRAGKFDAVITIFNAIGHLVKADFEKALQNIRANLNPGGLYLFDILNLEALTDEVLKTFTMDIESTVNGVKMRNTQYSEIDRKHGLLVSHDQYTLFRPGNEPEIRTNQFSLQLYTSDELNKILDHNGFDIMHQYDLEGNDFCANSSLSILTLARKR